MEKTVLLGGADNHASTIFRKTSNILYFFSYKEGEGYNMYQSMTRA